ncbi:MAG TPA: adenine deaminase C-terminal domain-containing protein [Virgibacillus sp.]|nr:adenine deaminase C-terminal domain-containing protein [Virgibacillus sp.]
MENGHYWRNRERREHVAVIDGEVAPTLILKNGIYLNSYTKQWLKANIWILHDRIVYVGDEWPENDHDAEVVDCKGKYLVPGYMEPHAHPFQVYNPEELAYHVAKTGTTTLINDNLMWHFLLHKKKAFTLLDDFNKLPISMYWWARFDSQTALKNEEKYFNSEDVLDWLSHPSVIQGGELTAWPSLLDGDDRLLYWIQEAKRLGKPIEGHLPGASRSTLTKMKLLGVTADHEAMTGDEAIRRLQLGYQVGLRYSSIRPDLPTLLDELMANGIASYENLTMTTDGATPSFYKEGMMNVCIQIAIDRGVPVEDAYQMATFNVANHFNMESHLGSISPGRIAHINILNAKDNPHPVSVLAKGEWIIRHGKEQPRKVAIDWEKHDIHPLHLDWELDEGDMQFSIPVGLDMINNVIIKPYAVEADVTMEALPTTTSDAFLLMLDRDGEWRVNTTLRGFTKELGGLVSSYSTTGDIVCIGKRKKDIQMAWKRMKELGGGIVLAHMGEIIFEIPLQLGGTMFKGSMDELMEKETELKQILKDYGYGFEDPVYSILFLAATHLPYFRVTQQGIVDVKKRHVLFPSTMR